MCGLVGARYRAMGSQQAVRLPSPIRIDAIGELGALPPKVAKEIEYVLDLAPR